VLQNLAAEYQKIQKALAASGVGTDIATPFYVVLLMYLPPLMNTTDCTIHMVAAHVRYSS
jgi:hypothetical protein